MVRIEDDDEQMNMIKIMTCRKCWTASGREAVGGAANNVAAIFLSIHESCNSWNCSLLMFELSAAKFSASICRLLNCSLLMFELVTACVSVHCPVL